MKNKYKYQIMQILMLLVLQLFCGCEYRETKQKVEKAGECLKAKECPQCQISEKCIALLAYGMLSDDEFDIPFGGACKDIVSDSLVSFLNEQKYIFKKWQRTEKINTNRDDDIFLLNMLISISADMDTDSNSKEWKLNTEYAATSYDSDHSFIWRFYLLAGIAYDTGINPAILRHITSFNDFAAYLDSSFADNPSTRDYPYGDRTLLSWCKCEYNKQSIRELKKYSKTDLFIKYYDSRCKNEDTTNVEEQKFKFNVEAERSFFEQVDENENCTSLEKDILKAWYIEAVEFGTKSLFSRKQFREAEKCLH
ncbi:MAG: hypothetical protein LBH25_05475 [Fibromonadaceae bacterium]|jgi:hypothetical protein|nr:hypothetical protein [Fibromonadaceae bacterium]